MQILTILQVEDISIMRIFVRLFCRAGWKSLSEINIYDNLSYYIYSKDLS
jgi:hypothetical protein